MSETLTVKFADVEIPGVDANLSDKQIQVTLAEMRPEVATHEPRRSEDGTELEFVPRAATKGMHGLETIKAMNRASSPTAHKAAQKQGRAIDIVLRLKSDLKLAKNMMEEESRSEMDRHVEGINRLLNDLL